jgi:hypothetical protein
LIKTLPIVCIHTACDYARHDSDISMHDSPTIRPMCLILERLEAGLQDRSPRESAKFYTENFSIAKVNLNLSMNTIFAAPETPLQVIRYLYQSPQENDHIKLRWLEQAQIMWSLVSGESASESQRRIMELLLVHV